MSSLDDAKQESHCCTSSHSQSYLDNSQDDLGNFTKQKFEGHIFFAACSWSAGETFEEAVRAVVEVQLEEWYLPTVPVAVCHMKSFDYSAAEPDRGMLKLQIQGYVQA